MAKENKGAGNSGLIELKQTETGIKQEFELSHAERILSYDLRIGKTNWELTDTKLKFQDGKINTGSGDTTDQSA